MNLVFVIGRIVSEIKFDFVLNSTNISIVNFEIELNNKNIVKVKGYNEVADFCYCKLNKNDTVSILGSLDSNMEIIVKEISGHLGRAFLTIFKIWMQ